MTEISASEPDKVIKALLRLGVMERKERDSHWVFRHPTSNRMTVTPIYAKERAPEFVKEIIKQSGIAVEKFLDEL